jgi:hypothetical protein
MLLRSAAKGKAQKRDALFLFGAYPARPKRVSKLKEQQATTPARPSSCKKRLRHTF